MNAAPGLTRTDTKHAPEASWLALINPAAGYHYAPNWLPKLEQQLGSELGARVVVTRDFEHIASLLDEASTATHLVVFGGDGTLAEVVNRMDLERQRLLPLPGGTGNGLARDLGLTSVKHALAAVRENATVEIDLVQVTFEAQGQQSQRLVVSTAGLGYVAEVVVFANQLARQLGMLRYTLASLARTLQMPACLMTVQLENQPPQQQCLASILVNNTRFVANYYMFEQARLNDGRMDLLLSNSGFWEQTIENLAMTMRQHTTAFRKSMHSTACLHIQSPIAMRLMLDGEIWEGVTEARFVTHLRRLQCYSRQNLPDC